MTAKDHIKILLNLPSLEYDRQVERVAEHCAFLLNGGRAQPNMAGFWASFSAPTKKKAFEAARAIIDSERQEVLSSLHISGALHGAVKALEDAERRIADLDAQVRNCAVTADRRRAMIDKLEAANLRLMGEVSRAEVELAEARAALRDVPASQFHGYWENIHAETIKAARRQSVE